MNVQIESLVYEWDSDTASVIVRFINLVLLAKTRRELETALDFTPFKSLYQKHLTWGFGKGHMWCNQKNPYNGQVMERRLMIVEFN